MTESETCSVPVFSTDRGVDRRRRRRRRPGRRRRSVSGVAVSSVWVPVPATSDGRVGRVALDGHDRGPSRPGRSGRTRRARRRSRPAVRRRRRACSRCPGRRGRRSPPGRCRRCVTESRSTAPCPCSRSTGSGSRSPRRRCPGRRTTASSGRRSARSGCPCRRGRRPRRGRCCSTVTSRELRAGRRRIEDDAARRTRAASSVSKSLQSGPVSSRTSNSPGIGAAERDRVEVDRSRCPMFSIVEVWSAVAASSTSCRPNERRVGVAASSVWVPSPSSETISSGALLSTVTSAALAPVLAGSKTTRTSQRLAVGERCRVRAVAAQVVEDVESPASMPPMVTASRSTVSVPVFSMTRLRRGRPSSTSWSPKERNSGPADSSVWVPCRSTLTVGRRRRRSGPCVGGLRAGRRRVEVHAARHTCGSRSGWSPRRSRSGPRRGSSNSPGSAPPSVTLSIWTASVPVFVTVAVWSPWSRCRCPGRRRPC